jgi:hypothetical protein
MELAFFIVWEWFKWLAIRLALFLALLSVGPSISLIVFDIMLYVSRTAVDKLGLGASLQLQPDSSGKSSSNEQTEPREKTAR